MKINHYVKYIVFIFDRYLFNFIFFFIALDWIKGKGEAVVHCSTIAIVNNLLSLLSGVSTKPHFAMMLIAGLGSNLTPASKKLFAYEV